MLSTLLNTLFGPPKLPSCPGTGSKLLSARRAATDEKYTARPLDFFPNPLVSREELDRARAEAGVLDGMFVRYKREASCERGPGLGRKWKGKLCELCGWWCCNVSVLFCFFWACLGLKGMRRGVAWCRFVDQVSLLTYLLDFQACRFHTSYRIVCSSPLLFSDEVHVPPGCSDHALLAPNKRMQTLQIRLRDHEHPYDRALAQQYAQVCFRSPFVLLSATCHDLSSQAVLIPTRLCICRLTQLHAQR
jgi:hypothetical protein